MTIVGAASSVAEPDKKPSDFYEQNYAASPDVGGHALQGDEVPQPVKPQAPNSVEQPGSLQGATEPDVKAEALVLAELFVNSKDRAHLARAIQGALTLTKNRKVLVTKVVHIGDYRNIDQATRKELQDKHIILLAASALPKDLPVSTSPAWVLQTDHGRYLVEGTNDIGRFVTTSGEFVVPVKPVATPPPVPVMADF